jgi:flagellar hook-associated protein 3 FlgL
MRITNQMIHQSVSQSLQRTLENMQQDQIKLATQRRINRHADDPIGSAQVRALRADLASIEQFRRNIDNATIWLHSTESALENLETVLQRGKQLTVEAASANRTAADRELIAVEINELLESVFSIANSEVNGDFLFAGQDNTTAPYVAARDDTGQITGITMAGDPSGSIRREVETGSYAAVNVPGTEVFDLATGPFATLISLRDALQQNDLPAIQNALTLFDNNLNDVLSSHGAIGGVMARLAQVDNRLELRGVDVRSAISELEDVDFAELLARSSANETAYRAALSAGSRLLQTSLLDFLR